MRGSILILALAVGALWMRPDPAMSAGDAAHGAQLFPACRACHSLEPGRNMTGPSLAGLWGRKAGSLDSFERYSPALKESGVVWNENTLDAWLKNPAAFIPHNRMTFPGIKDDKVRADLIAYLKGISERPIVSTQKSEQSAATFPELKTLPPEAQVKAIRHCHDSYYVTTGDGTTLAFWEPNLHFKTDSTKLGPAPGAPAILGAGSLGDRGSIIFASPDEISAAIKSEC